MSTVHGAPANRGRPSITDTLYLVENRQEREAGEVDEARIAEKQHPNKDAVTPEDGKQSILTSMSSHDPALSKPLEEGEKTRSEEGIGSGLPWGNVEIINVSIVRRSMG